MIKICRRDGYNWEFNTATGYFRRWGNSEEEDPKFSPVGPEILDIEVSTICHQGCKFCYKNNTGVGKNMSIETFKTILDKIKGNLTQVAFGIGDLKANPDLIKMFLYCRVNDIIPNVTINGSGLDEQSAKQLAELCGAVSVSNYNKDVCYNAVKLLTDSGLKQVNIHQLLCDETIPQIKTLLTDFKGDPRLKKLHAIVFLSLKQKGRGVSFTPIKPDDFNSLCEVLLSDDIPSGFDSCTANKFLSYVDKHPEYRNLELYTEPCESGLFSSYINVDGIFYPCSFAERNSGIDVVNCKDFMTDVWNSTAVIFWRNLLLKCNRNCPLYKI